MTLLKNIPLDALEKSPLNERLDSEDYDSQEFQELLGSIEAVGDVNDPLLVRPAEEGYEVIKGSRRLEAARKADGVTTVRCEVADISDGEALQRTITDNITSFKKDITARERALSLYQLWDEEGDTLKPSARGLADLLGVGRSTVSHWLEPLSEEWEDTIVNPLSADQHDVAVQRSVRELSARKLRSIRKATGGGEKGIELAEKAVEHDLTLQDLAKVRQHIENGASIDSAVGVVTGELSIADIEAEIEPDETETDHQPADESSDENETRSTVNASASSGGSENLSASSSWNQSNASTTESTDTGSPTTANPMPSPSPSATTTTAETDTESTSETTTGTTESATTDSPEVPERYQGRDLVASPEEIEAMKETRGWADTLEEIGDEEDADLDVEPVEFNFVFRGKRAAAARAAIEHHAAEDPADLGDLAVTRFLKEGKWLD